MSFVAMGLRLLSKMPAWAYMIIACCATMLIQHSIILSVESSMDRLAAKALVDSLNAEARNSKTRKIADAYMREAVQEKLRADSLDKKLKLQPKFKGAVVVNIDSVRGEGKLQKATMGADAGRAASFSIDNERVFGEVDIAMPFDSTYDPVMHYSLGFKPIPLAMAIGCKNGKSIVAIRPPSGIKLELESMRQDQDICNPPHSNIKIYGRNHRKIWVGLGLAIGGYIGYKVGSNAH